MLNQRKSSTLLCSCIFIALQTPSSSAANQHQEYFGRLPPRSLSLHPLSRCCVLRDVTFLLYLGTIPACLISLWHFHARQHVSPASHPSDPAAQVRAGTSARRSPNAQTLRGGCWPGLQSRGLLCLWREGSTCTGPSSLPAVMNRAHFPAAEAAISWASSGACIFLEVTIPKRK